MKVQETRAKAQMMLNCVRNSDFDIQDVEDFKASIILTDAILRESLTIEVKLDHTDLQEILQNDKTVSFYGQFDLSERASKFQPSAAMKYLKVWKQKLSEYQRVELVKIWVCQNSDSLFCHTNLTEKGIIEILSHLGLHKHGAGATLYSANENPYNSQCKLYASNRVLKLVISDDYKKRKPKHESNCLITTVLQLCDFEQGGLSAVPNVSNYEHRRVIRRTGSKKVSAATMKARYQKQTSTGR